MDRSGGDDPAGELVPVTHERCNTPGDLLHRLVREGLPELRRALDEANRSLPR